MFVFIMKRKSVEGASVHIRIRQEVSQLVPFLVVMQHAETFIAEQTRVAGRKLVPGGVPPTKTRTHQRSEVKDDPQEVIADVYGPADEDVADGTFLGHQAVLMGEQRVKVRVQAVAAVRQSAEGRKKKLNFTFVTSAAAFHVAALLTQTESDF